MSEYYRIPRSKLRSRDGFTQNRDNVWGHCEMDDILGGIKIDCFNRTLFRCDKCRQFICASHQSRHKKECGGQR